MELIWVLVNCTSDKEAEKIGDILLNNRLISCYDIFPRKLSKYFWTPKTNKFESVKGAMLTAETFKEKYQAVKKLIEKNHSDDLPFIGYINIYGTDPKFQKWVKNEVK